LNKFSDANLPVDAKAMTDKQNITFLRQDFGGQAGTTNTTNEELRVNPPATLFVHPKHYV